MIESIIEALFDSTLSTAITLAAGGGLGGKIISKIIVSTFKSVVDTKKIARNAVNYIDEKDYIQRVSGTKTKDVSKINIKKGIK